MGHRRWLPPDHIWRRKKNSFNGYEEHRLQPSRVEGEELLEQLRGVSHVQFGKSSLKRKRTPNQLNWTKKSIFFELPYWLDLGLRHNLDIMHIEKNICDNVLGTLLNIDGKTKDSANARRDLANLGLRKELHLQHDGDLLHQLQANIPIILCKLEMIFPPAFFDIMVHLAIHLSEEALLVGLVQYRWMYPFKRYLGKFKMYVRNRAHPEGSIAEAYVHLECLTFCSMYLRDIETRYNREERNSDVVGGSNESGNKPCLSVLSQKVRPLGTASSKKLSDTLMRKAQWEHYNILKEEDPHNIDRRHQNSRLRAIRPSEVTDDIYALACGPDPWVASYAGCIMNGVRFHTKERERHRRTQNSGVVVHGEHHGSPVDFYGVLHDIIELRYMGWHKVYLFSCAWYDVGDPRRGIHVRDHFTIVNTARHMYKDEPFALAAKHCKCFISRT
ncbi:uncharacterized protein LOC121247331 [Juglans microcarpa x Juglans regia]|uniref:uncharacterized protein LOC121247331 n=1 Tax=Juglans microcarpa x Juglans regia TaxID=2249226 RepID=UPI001B7E7E99|nr:uncharacterized protein LOC121247331 [Juglans microcarpa x Juglans regia]